MNIVYFVSLQELCFVLHFAFMFLLCLYIIIHIKYKNDDLSEDIINEKTFDILRERNDIGEDMIERLKGVF